MINYLVGTVKDSKKYQSIKGMELIVTQINDNDEFMIIGPTNYEDIEKYYKAGYEEGLKECISDDFNYCIWYLLNEDCELVSEINKKYLKNIRTAKEEDLKLYSENIEIFKKNHGYYDFEREIEKNDIEQCNAKAEFEKLDKIPIEVKCTDETIKISGAVYKGYGVHYPVSRVNFNEVTITVLNGESKGKMLCTCEFRKYKSIIDQIVDKIGDRPLRENDKEDIKIVKDVLKNNL